MAWSQTDFEYLLVEGNSVLLYMPKFVRERDVYQLNPTRTQNAADTMNKQAKEEIVCVGLKKRLEQSLQDVGKHILLKGSFRKALKDVNDFGLQSFTDACCYLFYPQLVENWIISDMQSHPRP